MEKMDQSPTKIDVPTIPIQEILKWPVFSFISRAEDIAILNKARLAYVFGKNGMIITTDDEVFGIGPENGSVVGNTEIFWRIPDLCGKKVIDFKTPRGNTALALTKDGGVYSWGAMGAVLGQSKNRQVRRAATVRGNNEPAVVCGPCPMPTRVGLPLTTSFSSRWPPQLSEFKVIELATSSIHVLALTDGGTSGVNKVWVWGEGQKCPEHSMLGPLKRLPKVVTFPPIRVPVFYSPDNFMNFVHGVIVSVACCSKYSLMLTNTGKLFCVMNCFCRAPHLIDTRVKALKIAGGARCIVLSDKGKVYTVFSFVEQKTCCVSDKTQTDTCGIVSRDDRACYLHCEFDREGQIGTAYPTLKESFSTDDANDFIVDIAGDPKSDLMFCKSYQKVLKLVTIRSRSFGKRTKLVDTAFATMNDGFAQNSVGQVMARVLLASQPLTAEYAQFTSLANSICRYWNDEESSDISFEVQREVIFAHKTILQMRSTHLQNMFDGRWKEAKSSRICIDEMQASTFRSFLYFLYHDKLDCADGDHDALLDILKLADCYGELGLRKKCELILKENLTIENVLEVFRCAAIYNALELKDYAFNFVMDHKSCTHLIKKVSRIAELKHRNPETREILLAAVEKMTVD